MTALALRERMDWKAPVLPSRHSSVGGRSQWGLVALVSAVGLLVQVFGYQQGWHGRQEEALALFYLGLLIIAAAAGSRLLGTTATRKERLRVSMVLTVTLTLSYYLRSPYLFNGFDELLHQATLFQVGAQHQLFGPNPELPVSPYYPGLELFTMSLRWLTGLPLVLCELATVLVSRVIVTAALYLTVERLCRSSLAAGVGVLAYAASPQFYAFNAQFSYQTIALVGACAAVYLIIEVAAPRPGRTPRELARDFFLCTVALCITAVSHHLVSWLTAFFLILVTVILALSGRRPQAKVVGAAAAVATVTSVGWATLAGSRLGTYLGPLFRQGTQQLESVLSGHPGRHLFRGAAGVASPWGEQMVMLAAAAIWSVVIVAASWTDLRRSTVRGGLIRLLPALVACCYPVVLLSRLGQASGEVGGRASTFVFFGAAVVTGSWLAFRRRWLRRTVTFILALLLFLTAFLGSMMLGSGPDFSYVPGPYMVGADNRSVDSASLAAARWEAGHIPVEGRIAADRVNGALAAGVGHLVPVTAIGGGINVGPLFFSRTFDNFDLSIVLRGNIRYLLVDDRLTRSRPAFGVYFEPGETRTPERLRSVDLDKFNHLPGVRRIYDNHSIQIYDLSSLLGLAPAPANGRGSMPGWGENFDLWLLIPASITTLLWAAWARRRRPRLEGVLRAGVAGLSLGMAGAALTTALRAPPTLVGLGTLWLLGVVALVGLSESPWRPGTGRPEEDGGAVVHDAVARRRAAIAGVLAASLTAGAVVVATLAAHHALRPPAQLSVSIGADDRTRVTAELTRPSASAKLIARGRNAEWVHGLGTGPGRHSVTLPSRLSSSSTRLQLATNGHVIRQVSG